MNTKGCDCLIETAKLLKERNTRVITTIPFRHDEVAQVIIATDKIGNRRDGKKAATLIATYCPFCGKKYPQIG